MDHTYDDSLKLLFKEMDFSTHSFKKYNPEIDTEQTVFDLSKEKGNMLQRNVLLLSRIFIQNAKTIGLESYFSDKKKLRILDMGCGHALNLLGILVYLGSETEVEYMGIDLNKEVIAECKKTYAQFPNVTFKSEDAEKVLKDDTNREQFDLVLIQHPNIEFERSEVCETFNRIYLNAEKVLAPGGIVYSSFYYASEIKYFENKIFPRMNGKIHQNDCFKHKLMNRFTGETYAPESFCYISNPKPVPQSTLKLI